MSLKNKEFAYKEQTGFNVSLKNYSFNSALFFYFLGLQPGNIDGCSLKTEDNPEPSSQELISAKNKKDFAEIEKLLGKQILL